MAAIQGPVTESGVNRSIERFDTPIYWELPPNRDLWRSCPKAELKVGG